MSSTTTTAPQEVYDVPHLKTVRFKSMPYHTSEDFTPIVNLSGYKVLGQLGGYWEEEGAEDGGGEWKNPRPNVVKRSYWNQWTDYRNRREAIYRQFCLRVFDYPLQTPSEFYNFLTVCRRLPTINGRIPNSYVCKAICLAIASVHPLTYQNFQMPATGNGNTFLKAVVRNEHTNSLQSEGNDPYLFINYVDYDSKTHREGMTAEELLQYLPYDGGRDIVQWLLWTYIPELAVAVSATVALQHDTPLAQDPGVIQRIVGGQGFIPMPPPFATQPTPPSRYGRRSKKRRKGIRKGALSPP